MFRLMIIAFLGTSCTLYAQSLASTSPSTQLPGKGLSQHDFLYAGEAHERKIFIVRQGRIVWSYEDTSGKGEISDAVMLSNGNILYARQYGVTEIDAGKKVIWNYDAPKGHEIHTAVPIGKEHVLYIMNGDPVAVVRVVNIVTGAIEKEFNLPIHQPVKVHTQFRHARLTTQGTLLVAHLDLNKVVEYDSSGKERWSFPGAGSWGVSPLDNGNILITDHLGVREITRRGDAVWSFRPSDLPDYHFANLQLAWRLSNGNTVLNSWANEWQPTGNNASGGLQAIELTPDKKVVWVLQSWTPPENLGPATTLQFLDAPSAPENLHFGEIH